MIGQELLPALVVGDRVKVVRGDLAGLTGAVRGLFNQYVFEMLLDRTPQGFDSRLLIISYSSVERIMDAQDEPITVTHTPIDADAKDVQVRS